MPNNKKEMMAMEDRLEDILSRGIELYMDGQPASPSRIAERFVREDMPDFVIDEEGILTQVRYDKIKEG